MDLKSRLEIGKISRVSEAKLIQLDPKNSSKGNLIVGKYFVWLAKVLSMDKV